MTAFREAFPIVHVDDVERTVSFYCSVFGFQETFRHEEDGRPVFAFPALEPLGIGVGERPVRDDHGFSLDLDGHLVHVGAKAQG